MGGRFPAFAAETATGPDWGSPDKPIRIQAEQLVADMDANTVEFCGDVCLTQEGAVITADSLTIHFIKAADGGQTAGPDLSTRKISKMVARGRVAIELQRGAASAEEVVYVPEADLITLSGKNASFSSAEGTLTGSRISFSRKDGRLTAEGRPPGRVVFTLAPPPKRR
jgi:lipopolysaccharide transport protein LptA